MTIKELIKILEKQNPALEVYLSGDSEGNYFGTIDKTLLLVSNIAFIFLNIFLF